MLVLVYHIILIGDWSEIPNTGFSYLLRHGWVGVDLFFTISGFVITLSALDGVEKHGRSFARRFAIRRLARIVPLYLLTSLVFLVLVRPAALATPAPSLAVHIGSHLLFVHNLHHSTHGSINGPSWSVALEMQFYLAMLLAAPWLARIGALRVLLYAVVIAAIWRFATTLVLVPGTAEPVLQFIYSTQLPGVIDEFAVGIAIAMVVHRNSGRLAVWLSVSWTHCLAWLALSVGLLTVAARLEQAFMYWNHAGMVVAWRPLLAAGFAALLASALSFPWADRRALAPLRYLGDISYGLYLWHMLVLVAVTGALPNLKGSRLLVVVLCSTFALASLTWHLLEKPNLKKYKGPHPTPPEGAP